MFVGCMQVQMFKVRVQMQIMHYVLKKLWRHLNAHSNAQHSNAFAFVNKLATNQVTISFSSKPNLTSAFLFNYICFLGVQRDIILAHAGRMCSICSFTVMLSQLHDVLISTLFIWAHQYVAYV